MKYGMSQRAVGSKCRSVYQDTIRHSRNARTNI